MVNNMITYTQVVFIANKSLTIQGGYTMTNWDTRPNPYANPSVIDAQQHGRGVTILGNGFQKVTIAGFTITGGDYTGLGNGGCNYNDCGGGLFASNVILNLKDSLLQENIASRTRSGSDGGGVYLTSIRSGSSIEHTEFISNSAPSTGAGGGLSLRYGQDISITGCLFEHNRAGDDGGGAYFFQPNGLITILDSTFYSNTSYAGYGGPGGGALEAKLVASGAALSMQRVTVRDNWSAHSAAAINIIKQGTETSQVDLTNIIIANNRSGTGGPYASAINAALSSGNLGLSYKHLTLADQPGIAALRYENLSASGNMTATVTNTLIVNSNSAFSASNNTGQLLVRHINTLVQNVTTVDQTEAGTPVFEPVNTFSGDARLNAAYHLQAGSAAIDAGVEAGVIDDIDKEPRPVGPKPDIGADEFGVRLFLPLIVKMP